MRLSADRLIRIVGAWNSRAEPLCEQRRDTRLDLRGTAPVSILLDDEPGPVFGARVCDLSSGGAGLLVHQPLQRGDKLLMRLPLEDAAMPIVCKVRHVRQVGEHLFRVGTAFMHVAAEVDTTSTNPMLAIAD